MMKDCIAQYIKIYADALTVTHRLG